MKYILADKNLVIGGRCFEGFPLLIGIDGRRMEPAQDFLWDLIAHSGRIASRRSWDVYGRAMYDFFAFVQTNGLDWKGRHADVACDAIEAWRDWNRGTMSISPNTINQRLRIVTRFYQWAIRKGLIDRLPFDHLSIQTRRTDPGFLAHVDAKKGEIISPAFMLPERKVPIRFLTKDQIKVAHIALSNRTHALMFELMVRTGLRQIECRTFPDAYVFDPSRRKDLQPSNKIRLRISPADMEIKGSKARDIDLPYDLMERLWVYSVRHRQVRANNGVDGHQFTTLFLTEQGAPYTKQAIGDIFRKLGKRVGFKLNAHMLRHSYATYLLWSLRKSETFQGEPLLYVRDRMGHSDVSTTTLYLHLINTLEGQLVMAHEDEIDKLFAAPVVPASADPNSPQRGFSVSA